MSRRGIGSGETSPQRGRLGRTLQERVLVTSDTGHIFETTITTAVHAEEDPEARRALLDDTLNVVSCPLVTGRRYRLAVPVLYHAPSLELLALVLPEGLRHEELRRRAEVLRRLDEESEALPAYARELRCAFGAAGLRRLEEARRVELEQGDQGGALQNLKLARQRAKLETLREELEVLQRRLEGERDELEQERGELEQERRALEQQAVEQARGEEPPRPQRSPDAFSSMMRLDELSDVLAAQEATAGLDEDGSEILEANDILEEAVDPAAAAEWAEMVPEHFDVEASAGRDDYVTVLGDDLVLAAFRLRRDAFEELVGVGEKAPQLFVQYHEIQGVPVVALLLARLDERQQPVRFVASLLNLSDSEHRRALEILQQRTLVRFAFYDRQNRLLRSLDIEQPLADNVRWITTERVAAHPEHANISPFAFRKVVEQYHSPQFERLGSLRHNFHADSFTTLKKASETRLAAGIVDYWSSPERLKYLVANRSFPLPMFRRIQRRVLDAAVPLGLHLEEPLRRQALAWGVADDEGALAELLLANFAELNVGIGGRDRQDLDPVENWENWEALLELACGFGVEPQEAELELAQIALRRAREFQELGEQGVQRGEERAVHEAQEAPQEEEEEDGGAGIMLSDDDVIFEESGVFSRTSEKTGVTYFVPDADVIGVFEDIAELGREDLERLLDDPNGRLEAAQVLLTRFSEEAGMLELVMTAAEEMTAGEIAALARFVECTCDNLEAPLIRVLESSGPSATYVAARALAASRSRPALPLLLAALRDGSRELNREAVARTLVQGYGADLLPELTRTIEEQGADEPLLLLLSALERHHVGTLERLSRDGHERVRQAVEVTASRRG